MQKDYLDIQIIFPNEGESLFVGESRIGKIIFRPKMDLYVDSLGYQYGFVAKGTMIPSRNTIIKKELIRNGKIENGKTYEFKIEIKGQSPISYQGENVEIKCKIKAYLDLRADSFLAIEDAYKKKKRLLSFSQTQDLLIPEPMVIQIKSNADYKVKNSNREIETSGRYPWIFFGLTSLSFASFLTYSLGAASAILFLGGVFLLFLFLVAPYYYKANILKSLKIDTRFLGNNQFAVILGLTKNVKNIKKVEVYYAVREEVRDRRGTSNTVYNHQCFKSHTIEKQKLSEGSDVILDYPELAYDFIFDFPKEELPTTLNVKDLKFTWEIFIAVYFPFGLKSVFIKEIHVVREFENNSK